MNEQDNLVVQLNEENINRKTIYEIKSLTNKKLPNSIYANLSNFSFENYILDILKRKNINIFIINKSKKFNGFFFCGTPKLQFDTSLIVKLIILFDILFHFKFKILIRTVFAKLKIYKLFNSSFSKKTIDEELSVLNIAMLESSIDNNATILLNESIRVMNFKSYKNKYIFTSLYFDNNLAINFYKKNKFSFCGELNTFFEKKIVMYRALNDSC